MSAPEQREPWAWAAFGVAGLAAAAFVVLGSRPGGALPVRLYALGLPALGLAAAALLALGLAWSVTHRPVLGRRRLAPLLAVGATLFAASFPLPYPSSHDGRPSRHVLVVPLEGPCRVVLGGDPGNPLVLVPERRFGYVLAPVVPEGAPGDRADGADRADRAPAVLAPVAGRVVLARGERPADDEVAPALDPVGALGLVLEVAPAPGAEPSEWCVLLGFDPEAPLPGPGTRVEAGDPLGRLGKERRLGLSLQDRHGEGIPARLGPLELDGRTHAEAFPVTGQTIRAVPGPLTRN